MYRLALGILRWPWRKIVKVIVTVANWILSILPEDPPKPKSR